MTSINNNIDVQLNCMIFNLVLHCLYRISDMKYAHDTELSSVRSSLEDEKHTRTTLEQNLNLQQQHELTIDIEDDSRDEEEVGGAGN